MNYFLEVENDGTESFTVHCSFPFYQQVAGWLPRISGVCDPTPAHQKKKKFFFNIKEVLRKERKHLKEAVKIKVDLLLGGGKIGDH